MLCRFQTFTTHSNYRNCFVGLTQEIPSKSEKEEVDIRLNFDQCTHLVEK